MEKLENIDELEEQKLPPALQKKITKFLTAIPNIHDSNAQQAFINNAGLDSKLYNQIKFGGPPTQFFQLLVPTLRSYGKLKDGRDALEAVLESAKDYVGKDKRDYCDMLIQELRVVSDLAEQRPQKRPLRVLFVDDEEGFRHDVGKDLERKGHTVVNAGNSKELREIIEKQQFDVILLDLMMPDKDGNFSAIAGIEDLKFLKQEKNLPTPVIVLSAFQNTRIITETLRIGAFDFLNKLEIGKNRELLFSTLNGAATQSTLEIAQKEKDTIGPEEEIEVTSYLQFSIVPTGIYRQFDVGEFPQELIKYVIRNNTHHDVNFSITTEIERFSDTHITNIKIKKGKTDYVNHSPVLNFEKISALKDIEDATIQHSISYTIGDKERKKKLNTEKIKLHPMTTMYWALENNETSRLHFLGNYIAAWVTPRSTPVEGILRLAVDYHPEGYIIGYQGSEGISIQEKREIVRTQLEAIYNALQKECKIKYIDSSAISFQGKNAQTMQKVRPPDETLGRASANCIDGAVLFASLIESAGMNPVIILIPGHAFVGWEVWEDANEFEYLETTMLSEHKFVDALNKGKSLFDENKKKGYFESGDASIINIREVRRLGIYPMWTQ